MADANTESVAGQISSLSTSAADVAVIGMAGVFPGAPNLRRYWQNICNRIDAITEVPPERWRRDHFFSEDRLAPDRIYSRWGGFLDPVPFDPVKWRIPPASVPHIEPIQLLSLETAWQAMRDSGYDPLSSNSDFSRERAGVLFAVSGSHELGTAYCFRTMMRHYLPRVEGLSPEAREQIYASLEGQLPAWSEDSFAGFLSNVVAGRIAREFDFHGPNFIVDAACASSLAALFTAVQMLRAGTTDLMLVGGADGTNNAFGYMSFSRTHALSPNGRSRAFDDSGDGVALGEGVACIVLKRLTDARRDGDRIYAIVKGIGASSDGKNRSLTAPHPPGQQRAIDRAYEDAHLSPASVTLLEAHGTGTAVGDSAELTTLIQSLAPQTNERQRVAIGSVKSMIGHTKTVAGLASLIKTALALTHRVLPPTIGIDKPNRRVDLSQSAFYLNTETRPWIERAPDQPCRAGISSFGFGGTNFHVVLEEAPKDVAAARMPNWTPRAAELLLWRRASREEMVRDLAHLYQQLDRVDTDDLAALAAAVCADESARPAKDNAFRLAIVAVSVEDLRQRIRKVLDILSQRADINDPSGIYFSQATPVQPAEVCFLYAGQGSQSVNMLRDLVVGYPESHALFAEADRLAGEGLRQPLSRYIYPPPVFSEQERERQTAELQDTRIAQPALGLIELWATDLLERFGLRPAFVAGHSYGELVALHVAGCLSRADLLRLSAQRGRLCAEASAPHPGAMASVQADAATTEDALIELNLAIHIANRNAPDQSVIAGSSAVIDAAVEALSQRGLRTRRLPVSAAFHSPAMEAAAASLSAYLAGVPLQAPRLPVFSNTTGQRHADRPEDIRALLSRHLREPVLFEQAVRQIHAEGARVFLEVGPGKVLSDLVSRILPGGAIAALSLDGTGRDGWTRLGHALGRLAVLGLPVHLDAWFAGRGLTDGSLADFLARIRAETTPSPSAWWLRPDRAEPVTPQRVAGGGLRVAGDAAANPEHPIEKEKPRMNPAGNELFAQFQETTRLLIEAQKAQNRVLERYLEMQERLLQQANGDGAAPAAAATESPGPSAPTPRVRPAPAVVRPPIPIPRSAPITPSRSLGDFTASQRVAEEAHSPPSTCHSPPAAAVENGSLPPPAAQFRRDLLDVVSARTGYPIDALDETLALEAELGIDSIKTVEIFSQLKAYHRFFRAEQEEEEELLAEFTRLRTLRDIVESYERRRQTYVTVPSSNGNAAAHTVTTNGNGASNGSLKRYAVVAEAAPWNGNGEKKKRPTDGYPVLVIGDVPDVSTAVVAALTAEGYRVRRVASGTCDQPVGDNHYQVDLSAPASLRWLHQRVIGSGNLPMGGAINLLGLCPLSVADDRDEARAAETVARWTFNIIREFAGDLQISARLGGGWFVNVTGLGGQFGLGEEDISNVMAAGTLGIAKTLRREHPRLRVKNIDVDPRLPADVLAARLLQELAAEENLVEVGLTRHGRWRPALRELAPRVSRPLAPDRDAVYLVTGGACGVTAAVARGLANALHPRLILVGRSPLPGPEAESTRGLDRAGLRASFINEIRACGEPIVPAEIERTIARLLKDRQIRINLDACTAAGATVEYHALDVRDTGPFGRLIDDLYERFGRIDGVVHGAGVIEDRRIADKTPESFARVFGTKVDSAWTLARKLRPETLRFLAFFGSVSGRFGNIGQIDYSAANEALNKLANYLNRRWPGRVVCINWGPWDGGMVSEELRRLYAAAGVRLIGIEEGVAAFLTEIGRTDRTNAEIILAHNIERMEQRNITLENAEETPAA